MKNNQCFVIVIIISGAVLTLICDYDKIVIREDGRKMKINEKISGFWLLSQEDAPELSAKINIFAHEKSGAKLCFIDREDTNLSFAISFATPPKDDTGVFHIIEHSVLCGSGLRCADSRLFLSWLPDVSDSRTRLQ